MFSPVLLLWYLSFTDIADSYEFWCTCTAERLNVFQDYIDSMEGATLSGRQASAYICDAGEELVALRKVLDAEFKDDIKFANTKDELTLVWDKLADKVVTLTCSKFVIYACNIL